ERPAARGNGFRVLLIGAADFAAGAAGGDMETIVEAPAKGVEHSFAGGVAAETREDPLHDVRLAVAVGVLAVEDVGRRADENTAVVAGDGHSVMQVVHVGRRLIEDAVAVGVFEHPYAPVTFEVLVGVLVVLRVL